MDGGILDELADLVLARDPAPLRAALMRLPFTTLEPHALYDLLGHLLDVATRIGSREMAELLLAVWGESNPTEEKISTFSMLFLQPHVPAEVLRRVVEVVRDVSYDEVATELMQHDDAPILTSAADRLDRAFGGRTFEQAVFLRNWARDAGAARLERYYAEVAGAQSPFAAVPDWVQSAPAGAALPTHDALIAALPDGAGGAPAAAYPEDTHTLARELVRGMRAQDMIFDEEQEESMVDVIRQQLNVATGADRAHFRAHFEPGERARRDELARRLDAGQNDRELFRVLGPVNLLTGDLLEGDGVCARWGGCRMLTCNMFERDEARAGLAFPASAAWGDGELEGGAAADFAADWFFLARCQRCDLRIRSRAHALREPLPFGGWRGCYCSPECLREAMAIGGNWNAVSAWTLQRVLEQLRAVGVRDRAPDPRPAWESAAREAQTPADAASPTRGGAPPEAALLALPSDRLLDLLAEDSAEVPAPWE